MVGQIITDPSLGRLSPYEVVPWVLILIKFLCGLWLVMAELVHQGSAVHAGPKRRYDVGITDLGELWHFRERHQM
jgi:hypothetical protein